MTMDMILGCTSSNRIVPNHQGAGRLNGISEMHDIIAVVWCEQLSSPIVLLVGKCGNQEKMASGIRWANIVKDIPRSNKVMRFDTSNQRSQL